MFGAPSSNGLTFGKVLGGISKTLNIANQVIPLYKEAKPMISNAKNILSVLKEFNKPKSNQKTSTSNANHIETNKKETNRVINNSNPSFFL